MPNNGLLIKTLMYFIHLVGRTLDENKYTNHTEYFDQQQKIESKWNATHITEDVFF